MTRTAAALAFIVTAAALTARADVLWKSDYSTGKLSAWNKVERVAEDRLRVVPDPLDGGEPVLRVDVEHGDDPINASGNRNEVVFTSDEAQGERVYRWSTLWPQDYRSENTWQLFTQWHHTGTSGSPPIEFYVRGEDVILRVNGEEIWTTPLERGRWHDFVFAVNWAEGDAGWVELAYDGALVLPRTTTATLYPGEGVYLKQGLYRKDTITWKQTLYHSAMTVATSVDDVQEEAPQGGSSSEALAAGGSVTADGAGEGGTTTAALPPDAVAGWDSETGRPIEEPVATWDAEAGRPVQTGTAAAEVTTGPDGSLRDVRLGDAGCASTGLLGATAPSLLVAVAVLWRRRAARARR